MKVERKIELGCIPYFDIKPGEVVKSNSDKHTLYMGIKSEKGKLIDLETGFILTDGQARGLKLKIVEAKVVEL